MTHHDARQLELLATNFILQLGIPANLKGYYFIREGVVMSVCEPEVLDNISGKVYIAIAQNHGITPACVAKAIATAIRTSCKRGCKETFADVFGEETASEIKRGKKTIANKKYIVGLTGAVCGEYEENNSTVKLAAEPETERIINMSRQIRTSAKAVNNMNR